MKISHYLKASPELAAVARHAERLIELQHLLRAVAPPALAQHCRVANLKQGKLVLQAANSLVAVKLRQMIPSLTEEFASRGWEITGIQVGVQDYDAAPQHSTAGPAPLSAGARSGLAALAGATTDPQLRDALRHLLAAASGDSGHEQPFEDE
jgi:hypothetical protein